MNRTLTTDNGAGAASRSPTAVNTVEFIRAAGRGGYSNLARVALFCAIHLRKPKPGDKVLSIEESEGFPATMEYRELAVWCDAYLALVALETLENAGRARDAVSAALSRCFVLPVLAEKYPETLYRNAIQVVNCFDAWRGGHCDAETYGNVSMRFRVNIAIDYHCTDTNHLIEALPADGVDWYAYSGGSDPSGKWHSFCRYLASETDEVVTIEELRTQLPAYDPDLGEDDDGEGQWWNEALDDQIDATVKRFLGENAETIKGLIAEALATHPAE